MQKKEGIEAIDFDPMKLESTMLNPPEMALAGRLQPTSSEQATKVHSKNEKYEEQVNANL